MTSENGRGIMDKFLILGGNSGIGEAVFNLLEDEQGNVNQLFRPRSSMVNVANRRHVRRYITINGPFDYIVFSAGINKLQWIADAPEDGYANFIFTMDVNLCGFYYVVAEHVNAWPQAKVSAVAVSSDAGEIPMRGSIAYCVSKAALDMAVKVMARELAPLWRVNAVAPGMVEGTDMTKYIDEMIPGFRGWTPEYAREYERASVPSGRRATLEEVAETIRWVLMGPEQMTGAIIRINGGKS
jgi:NAD(P)-dependent dehydrogenase (short-subunit alcohol dehydrogenase family)